MDDIRILIVEDEQKIADTLKYGLIENGFKAETAYNGGEALEFFSNHFYHLILNFFYQRKEVISIKFVHLNRLCCKKPLNSLR